MLAVLAPQGSSEGLVVSMAVENPSWGYTRLRDVLRALGHEMGPTTTQGILKEQGIEPAPSRRKQMSWSEYRRAHLGAIAARDFLMVEVLTLRGLVRYHVLVVFDLASRRVEISGIACEPTGAWMMQAVRNLLDTDDGILTGKTKLIMDRDPVFTAGVRALLRCGGVEPVRLPARSPNLNAYAECFVLSIKSECLNRLVLLGEGHLRLAVREYVARYYHRQAA